jgi:hypothetical protein
MIDISWNKDNLKSFEKKMETIIKKLPETAKLGVEDSLKNTQEKALKNKRGNKDEKLIPIEILDFDKGKVVGRVYTNKDLFSHAPFLEYGTGTKAELQHIGQTKTFIQSGYRYWFLPVEKVDRQFSPERIIVIDGKQFYLMFATKPYPFMRPASFSSRQENADLVNERIGKMLMEVLK